jgi:hypothetical protein
MKLAYFVVACFLFSSCASALNPGPPTAYQKRKPAYGQPNRELRMGYVVLDIVFGVLPLAVDFATSKIYKPSPNTTSRKKEGAVKKRKT